MLQALTAIMLSATLFAATLAPQGPPTPPVGPTPATEPAPPVGPTPATEPAPPLGPVPSAGPMPPQPAAVVGPVVHVVPLEPDPTRGVLKLVKHHSTTQQAVGTNAILVTQLYDEICSAPCAIPIDVSERPVFYFIRDGKPVTKGFRLTGETGVITLRVKPIKQGLFMGGLYLTVFLLLPASIPMMVAGAPKVWIADGTPENHGEFFKLAKAKI